MKKIFSLLILPLLAFIAVSCSDDDEPKDPIDLNSIEGHWEIDNPNDFGYAPIFDIVTKTSGVNVTDFSGNITSYYTKQNEEIQHDKYYIWKIATVEDGYYPLIELKREGDLDTETGSQMANTFYYRIEKLTSTQMRWHINSAASGDKTVNFIRRPDLDK